MMDNSIKIPVREINKIIVNTLLSERAIHLPRLGSLRIVAKRSGKRSYEIEFLANERGRSLPNVVQALSKCSQGQAVMMYYKWLEEVQNGTTIRIEGLCTIEGQTIKVDADLSSRLNSVKDPKDDSSKLVSEKNKRPLLILAVALVVAAVSSALMLGDDIFVSDKVQKHVMKMPHDVPVAEILQSQEVVAELPAEPISAEPVSSESVSPEPASPESVEAPIEAPAVLPAEKIVEATPVKEAEQRPQTEAFFKKDAKLMVKSTRAKRAEKEEVVSIAEAALARSAKEPHKGYRVVFGAFSTTENAGRALLDLTTLTGDDIEKWRLDRYGRVYMLSLFDADNYDACRAYIDFGEGREISEQLWVSSPKK